MSGEIEAAGALATAGLAAGAIERGGAHGVGPHEVGEDGVCANCGAAVTGRYCANCGQPTHVHRSLGHFFEEVLHGLFHFDTKAWRTLPMVAFRPGTLTRNYIFGKRVRYISPVALFLFVVFVMFLVFAAVGEAPSGGDGPRTAAQAQATYREAEADVAKSQAALAAAQGTLDATTKAGGADADTLAELRETVDDAQSGLKDARDSARDAAEDLLTREQRIARLQAALARLDVNEARAKAENNADDLESIGVKRAVLLSALRARDGPPNGIHASIAPDGEVSVGMDATAGGGADAVFEMIKAQNAAGKITVNTGFPEWNKKIRHKLENPELAWYKIQNTAYKFSFLLVPLSLPFLWIMFFWKRGVTLFDHTVFALYSLCFASLLLAVMTLVMRVPMAGGIEDTLGGVMALSVPVHMFFHLKGAYALGVFSALWRTVFLLIGAGVALSFFVVSIFLLGMLG